MLETIQPRAGPEERIDVDENNEVKEGSVSEKLRW